MRWLAIAAVLCVLGAGIFTWNLASTWHRQGDGLATREPGPGSTRRAALEPRPSATVVAEAFESVAQIEPARLQDGVGLPQEEAADQTAGRSPAGDYPAAEEVDPASAPLRWAGQARTEAALERLAAARAALRTDPGHPKALRDELEALYQLGRWSEAADTLASLAAVEPGNPRWLRERAAILLRLSCFASAIEPLRQYLALVPQDAAGWSWLAAAQQSVGHLNDAERSWSSVLALKPQDPHALFHRGLLRLTLRDWSGAAADLERACELDPQNVEGVIGLSTALAELGQLDAARDRLSHVLNRCPRHVRAINKLAELYWRGWVLHRVPDDLKTAVEYWRRSLALDESQPEIQQLIEQALGESP